MPAWGCGMKRGLPCATRYWRAITITDILLIKPAFGTQSGDVNYDATFDLNSDGRISIVDILLLKPVFATSCP